jgi:hypothetical protein
MPGAGIQGLFRYRCDHAAVLPPKNLGRPSDLPIIAVKTGSRESAIRSPALLQVIRNWKEEHRGRR